MQGSVVSALRNGAKAAKGATKALPKARPKRVPTMRPATTGGPAPAAAPGFLGSADDGVPAAIEAPKSKVREAGELALDEVKGEAQERLIEQLSGSSGTATVPPADASWGGYGLASFGLVAAVWAWARRKKAQ